MFYIRLCLEDKNVICINDFYHDSSVNKIWAIIGNSAFNYLNIIVRMNEGKKKGMNILVDVIHNCKHEVRKWNIMKVTTF